MSATMTPGQYIGHDVKQELCHRLPPLPGGRPTPLIAAFGMKHKASPENGEDDAFRIVPPIPFWGIPITGQGDVRGSVRPRPLMERKNVALPFCVRRSSSRTTFGFLHPAPSRFPRGILSAGFVAPPLPGAPGGHSGIAIHMPFWGCSRQQPPSPVGKPPSPR